MTSSMPFLEANINKINTPIKQDKLLTNIRQIDHRTSSTFGRYAIGSSLNPSTYQGHNWNVKSSFNTRNSYMKISGGTSSHQTS